MKKKIKLLYTVPEFMYGSKVRQLCDLVRGLDRDLFDIEICSSDLGDEASAEVDALNVPVFRELLYPPRNVKISDWLLFLRAPSFILKKRYDIVHSLHYSSLFTEPLLFKFCPRTQFVYTKTNLQWENHPFQWYWRSLLSDAIVTLSDSANNIMASRGFEKKTSKIHIGVDCKAFPVTTPNAKKEARTRFRIPEDAFVFGYAAQFIEVKDHPTILKAFVPLAKRHRNCHLAFCGDNYRDGYYANVLDIVDQNDLADRVRLLGIVKEMQAFYAMCDCIVFPSRFENFSIAILEAMSSGLPIIAGRYGGNLEQVQDGINGYLADIGDSAAFETKMEKYLQDPKLALTHGAASRDFAVSVFSVEAMIGKTQALYLSLLRLP